MELGEPTATLPKLTVVGLTLAEPLAGVAPVPESATLSAVELLLTVIVQDAVSAPVVLGVKIMDAVQVPAAAKVVPQVVDEIVKSVGSVPERVPVPRVTELEVAFVMVTV